MAKRIKVRSGLYNYKGHTIEKLNEMAERYKGDDYYNLWRVTSPDNEIWLHHFRSLWQAMEGIDNEK